MLNPVTIAGAMLCVAMLWLKFRNRGKKRQPARPRLRAAKVLISAFLALLAVGFALRQLSSSVDGDASDQPSIAQRIFAAIAK